MKVKFNLDDDPVDYTLVYDFNHIVDAEQETGCNLLIAIASIYTVSATQMRALLYACLKTGHPTVLLAEAGELLTRDSGTVMTALAKVLGAEDASPKTDPKGDPAAPKEDPAAAAPPAA